MARTRTPGHQEQHRMTPRPSFPWRASSGARVWLAASRSPGSADPWGLPRADRGAVAVQDLGLVRVPGGGGAVGVQDQGPAPPVDHDLVVKEAQEHAVFDAGLAAVGWAASGRITRDEGTG